MKFWLKVILVFGLLLIIGLVVWIYFLDDDKSYYSKAIAEGSSKKCEKIKDAKMRDRCYWETVSRLSDCEKISEGSSIRDFCYDDLAYNANMLSFCEYIDDLNRRELCYQKIGIRRKDVSVCKKISHEGVRDICYSGVAVETRNPDLCKNVITVQENGECFSRIAYYKKDASLCERPIRQRERDMCYNLVAKETGDTFLCDKISGETEFSHDSCLISIAYDTKNLSICEESFYSDLEKERCRNLKLGDDNEVVV